MGLITKLTKFKKLHAGETGTPAELSKDLKKLEKIVLRQKVFSQALILKMSFEKPEPVVLKPEPAPVTASV